MHFVCGVHISLKIKNLLLQEGYNAVHLNHILDGDITGDNNIAKYCYANGCILITKDYDFVDSYHLKKMPPKIIKINLGNISNKILMERITALIPLLSVLNTKSNFLIEVNIDDFFIYED